MRFFVIIRWFYDVFWPSFSIIFKFNDWDIP
jgi:hypothetical protein